jgi:lipopolysaccharide biosynthesis protein
MSKSKIAVLIHLFYTDLWSEIELYLNNLEDYDYDLYINLVNGFYQEDIIEKIEKFKPTVKFLKSPNKGVDVGGFLYQYNSLEKDYDLILKIHTKKSLGLPDKPSDYVKVYGPKLAKEKGNQWFHKLMKGVLSSKNQVRDIINLLENDTPFAMAGLDCETYIGPNLKHVKDLADKFNIPVDFNGDRIKNASFVGGTIFWVRMDILKKYLTKSNVEYLMGLLPNDYQNEPSYNHALERLFGMMVYNEKKKIINL